MLLPLAAIALTACETEAERQADAREDRIAQQADQNAATAGDDIAALGLTERQLIDADLVARDGSELGDVEQVRRSASGAQKIITRMRRLPIFLLTSRIGFPNFFAALKPPMSSAAANERRSAMSQPVSRFLHPFEVARHPTLEPEVKRAILASWASDHSSVKDRPALRHPPGVAEPVEVDDVFAALRALDDPNTSLQNHHPT